MSTILKALKRLDEQRRADAAPRTLEEQVLAGGGARFEDPGARSNKRLFIAIGAASVLLAVGVAWIALRERPSKVQPAPPAVAAQPVDPQQASARAPRGAVPSRGAPVSGTAFDPGIRDILRAQPVHGDAALTGGAASLRPAAGNQPEPGIGLEPELIAADAQRIPNVAAAPREELPSFDVQPAREGVPAPAPLPEASVRASESPAPEIARAEPRREPEPAPEPAIAPEPQREMAVVPTRPEVSVERTQWHPTPAKRSALVRVGPSGETRELHEGDALEGVLVKEIRPSGVLFLFEGEEFKRGVGGS